VVPDGITVHEYVRLGRTPHLGILGAERPEDVVAVRTAMDRLELAPEGDRRLDSLSGGELQRVVVARALAQAAPLLLLDEPTTGLDLGHQIRVLELIEGLRRSEGLTVLSTMHDLTLVSKGSRSDVLDPAVIAEHFGTNVRVIGDGDVGWAVVPVTGEP
jgi:iron complex transport system ATP-binding protein